MKKAEIKFTRSFWTRFGILGAAVVLLLLLSCLSTALKRAIAPPDSVSSRTAEDGDKQAQEQMQAAYTPEEQERADFRQAEREAAQREIEQKRLEQKLSEQPSEMPAANEWELGDSPSTVEGAFGVLYEEIFAPQGDTCECRFNAKGNWYVVLSPGTMFLEGETAERDTVRTLVFDRESKNGECWLIVYYEEILNEDGSEYSTAIRNTYAVNKAGEGVIPSGKRAWADVGTAEYQQATGEK